jgi:aminoglycoside phosphotransferase (APT) family kinase protein
MNCRLTTGKLSISDMALDSSDTQPVRASEQLNWDSLAEYIRPLLAQQLGDAFDASAPMTIEQFPGGHSNLTYLLRFGNQEFALRRPPFGPVPPKAHDIARECRILSAIHPVFPLAPKPYLLCEDASVIGSPFYIMERRHGLVVRHEEPPQLADQPNERTRVSNAVVDVLADLHLVDVDAYGLATLGKASGFVERQVKGWSERWHGSKTNEQPEMDALSKWLLDRLPTDPARSSLLHGDYKLDNIMLDSTDPGKLVAVFDWEMSAVGDALIDLGIFLAYWVHTANASQRDSLSAVTSRPGWLKREEVLERYADRTKEDVSNVEFYEVFAVFKIAVVLQQIFYRYRRGQTDDARFATLDKHVESLAQIGTKLATN